MQEQESLIDWLEKNSGQFNLTRRTHTPTQKDNFKIGRSSIKPTYSQFEEVNKLFKEYIPKVADPKMFVNQLYKMELAGAEIEIDNRKCIIVEERKNSIITISKDNILRTRIKAGLKFIFEHNNVKYLVIARNLKMNRFMKK
ncbi:hypothetical protein NGRA_2411 [Nosema granulosis]|uniref:Uncharacterized protein n=1 Tax=Nosema granulosis TaxID=83296 RepID=A0A9P6GWN1_9MICR|nr:hypothetical protein NGRA_2411 [Nosema granulosis]